MLKKGRKLLQFILRKNGKAMVSRIIIGMSIGLKVARLLNISAIVKNFLMVTKVNGTRMKKELNRGELMILTCLIGSNSMFD